MRYTQNNNIIHNNKKHVRHRNYYSTVSSYNIAKSDERVRQSTDYVALSGTPSFPTTRTRPTHFIISSWFFLVYVCCVWFERRPHTWSSALCTPPLPSPHPTGARHYLVCVHLYACCTVCRDAGQLFNLSSSVVSIIFFRISRFL